MLEKVRTSITVKKINPEKDRLIEKLGTPRLSKARNWKCPCGSGKKVKHCCGRGK